jgi:arginine decarboxylase
MFFTKGVGKHREKLTSFELALRSAGIAACNLVRVSSIFPPGCRIMSRIVTKASSAWPRHQITRSSA